MLKSFTRRFFSIYIFSTLLISIVLFISITQYVSRLYLENKHDFMLQEIHTVEHYYIHMYESTLIGDGHISIDYTEQVKLIGKYISSRILVFDIDKTVVIDSSVDEDSLIGTQIDNPIVRSVLSGDIIKKKSTFNHYYDDSILITAESIKYNDTIIGAVVILTPYTLLQDEMNYTYKLVLISLFIILSITIISTFILSKRISNTITELSHSVKKIANGDFTSRVHMKEDGEIGDLINSMNHMASELEKLEDMRKEFIANVSHDFRSPLTSIKGFVQAMLDGTIPHDRQDKYLHIVLDESERLTKLTNDILLLTKMENNTIQLNRSHFDLHQVIRKILLQFEHQILDNKIDFTLIIDQHGLFVLADVNQIQRVITNLIDNAIKFCSFNDKITVETTIIKDKVEISVKDTGVGISETDILYIWNRFHKADRSRGQDKKGIGLGLSIVREIIRAHDESINVYSQEGVGTTFVFTLPLSSQE